MVLEIQLEGAQEPGPLVEQAHLAQAHGADGAAAVEHPEALAVLQDPSAVIGARAGRQDVELLLDLDDLLHQPPFQSLAGKGSDSPAPSGRP